MNALVITLAVIFAATVVATILQRRARDPCFKKFHKSRVILQLKPPLWVWGSLEVHAKSLEVVFDRPHSKQEGVRQLSYVLFEDMLPRIQMVIRPLPGEGTRESRLWRRELRRIESRSWWFDFRRSLRNLLNTLRDAFSQSIGVILGQLRARNPALLAGADQKLVSTGQMLAAYGSNAYEPILEEYLGRHVITEMLVEDRRMDHVGILEEYSDKYILLRNVKLHPGITVPTEAGSIQHADVIFPRSLCVVRHLARVD